MKIRLLLFILLCACSSFAKRHSFEFGIGLGYQPRIQLMKTAGANQNVFKPKGFLSFDLYGGYSYILNQRNTIGFTISLVSVPFFYTFDLTGTQFSQKNPDMKKRGNTQGDNLGTDLGVLYRRTLLQRSTKALFLEVIPTVRLNASGSLGYSMGVGNANDSVTVFHIVFKEPHMVNLGGRLAFGVKKRLRTNFLILKIFYTRVFPNNTGQYFTMINTAEYNYGTFSVTNHQFGVGFSYGFGK